MGPEGTLQTRHGCVKAGPGLTGDIGMLRVSVSSLDGFRYVVANDGNDQTYRLSLRRDKEATESLKPGHDEMSLEE